MTLETLTVEAMRCLEMGVETMYLEAVGERLPRVCGVRGELRCVNARGNAVGVYNCKRLLKQISKIQHIQRCAQ